MDSKNVQIILKNDQLGSIHFCLDITQFFTNKVYAMDPNISVIKLFWYTTLAFPTL